MAIDLIRGMISRVETRTFFLGLGLGLGLGRVRVRVVYTGFAQYLVHVGVHNSISLSNNA